MCALPAPTEVWDKTEPADQELAGYNEAFSAELKRLGFKVVGDGASLFEDDSVSGDLVLAAQINRFEGAFCQGADSL